MSSDVLGAAPGVVRQALAKQGLFKVAVPKALGGMGGGFADVVHVVAETARTSPSSAILLASQRLLVEVLLQSENVGLMEYQLPSVLDGDIGGNCAGTWPLNGAATAVAVDTGRGWRMSGRLPALPNLERNWFLVSVPVTF